MSNFVENHPFFAMAMVCIVCNTVSDVVKYITGYHSVETYRNNADGSWTSEYQNYNHHEYANRYSDTMSESKKCMKYGEEVQKGIKTGLNRADEKMAEEDADREMKRIFDHGHDCMFPGDFDGDRIFAESDGDPNHEGIYDIPELKVTKS